MKHVAFLTKRYILLLTGAAVIASCGNEQPRSVTELMEDPRLLEATMVRCAENRAELKYTAECINAREASERLAVKDAEASRSQLEAESARKREALRRSRQAAEEARRRADEAERLRREAEYLGQFDELPAEDPEGPAMAAPPVDSGPTDSAATTEDGAAPVPEPGATLDDVRDELRRRQQPPQE